MITKLIKGFKKNILYNNIGEMDNQLFSGNVAEREAFKNLVRRTKFKGNPLRTKYDKDGNPRIELTNTYINFVKKNKFAPLPAKLILNPETNRIVKKSSILTKKGGIKKQYKDTLGILGNRIVSKEKLITETLTSNPVMRRNVEKRKYKTEIKPKIQGLEWGEELWIDLNKLSSLEDIIDMLNTAKDYLIETENGNTIYSLNGNSIQHLKDLWAKIKGGETVEMRDSDENIIALLKENARFKMTVRKPKKDVFKQGQVVSTKTIKKTKGGKFWRWYNRSDYELERYGIYREFNADNYTHNCFVYALKMSELPVEKLCSAEDKCFGKKMETKKIQKIANILNICIKVKFPKTVKGKVVSEVKTYGNAHHDKQTIWLGLIAEHYFLIEETPYFNVKKTNKKNSYTIVKELYDNKETLMEEMPNEDKLHTIYANEADELVFKSLEYNDWEFEVEVEKDENGKTVYKWNDDKQKMMPKIIGDNGGELKGWEEKKPSKDKKINVFFDFESVPFDEHKAWCCACIIDVKGQRVRSFFGEWCSKDMMEYVFRYFKQFQKLDEKTGKKKYTCTPNFIAHNLNYDYNFIQSTEGLSHNMSAVIKDNKIYSAHGRFFSLPVHFECSNMKMGCCVALSKFHKNFGIKQHKDVCPYGVYTITNIQRQYVPMDECLKHLRPSEQDLFKEMSASIGATIENKVDIIKYGIHYCEKDVLVLQEGYKKYQELFLKVNPKVDCDNFLTLASMAQEHFVSKGCYTSTYKLGGIARAFIQKFVVGGRTMLNSNKVQIAKGYTAVYDARSLYPSAIHFMEANGKKGILDGTPKIIPDDCLNIEWLKQQDGYFVLIKVNKVGIDRQFPILSYIDDKSGVRYFSNDMAGKFVYVDRFTLEDAIEFQQIEYEIIQGYYFDEGRNNTICNEMLTLYTTRKIKKKAGCKTEGIYKNCLNSAYGRTIMKASHSRCVYRQADDVEDYISKNFDALKRLDWNTTKERARIEEWCSINDHFSSPQVGAEILSYSKRIMNKVMSLAEDLGIHIYYQDTDSIHMPLDDVKKLEDAYLEKYGLILNGDDLGQFHVDLESGMIEGRGKELGLKEGIDYDLVSPDAYYLNKKDYCESMVGLLPDGTLLKDKDGKEMIDYSIHIKGIPTPSVWYKCMKEKKNPIEFFKQRYNYGIEKELDQAIVIDCMKTWCREQHEEWTRCSFEFHKNHTITNRVGLDRRVGIGAC